MSMILIGSISTDIRVISGLIVSIITITPMTVLTDVMSCVILWFRPFPMVSISFVILESTSP